jgi:hypothetical protein
MIISAREVSNIAKSGKHMKATYRSTLGYTSMALIPQFHFI